MVNTKVLHPCFFPTSKNSQVLRWKVQGIQLPWERYHKCNEVFTIRRFGGATGNFSLGVGTKGEAVPGNKKTHEANLEIVV